MINQITKEIVKIKDMYRINIICYYINVVMYGIDLYDIYINQSNYNFKASIRSPVLDMSREICRLKYVAHAQSIQALRALLKY